MLTLPKVEEPAGLNAFAVLYWNHVGLEMNRITHSLGGPQGGPTMSSRALGLLHLAMHDAFFGALGKDESSTPPTYLSDSERPKRDATAVPATLESANAALTGAAIRVLDALYTNAVGPGISIQARDTLTGMLSALIRDYEPHVDTLGAPYQYGVEIADAILKRLAVKPGEPGADPGRYEPREGRYFFRDEPVNPLRQVLLDPNDPSKGTRPRRIYHGPFYGTTVRTIAVHDDAGHTIAPPPRDDSMSSAEAEEYRAALREVRALGGAPNQTGTTRDPDGTVAGLYWAYDGPNLIGTPPRLYNQILRVIAWERRSTAAGPNDQAQNAEFVRLFALANTAMADAGKFCWKEKYRFEFWRPLSGVREHDVSGTHINADGDPFWLSLGAPDTNSNRVSFKPPFPAYPSGHATFGAACFQMARLFYKHRDGKTWEDNGPDDIQFKFVSEELNGISRDLRAEYDPNLPIQDQVGTVRTRIERKFKSLWAAIFENAFSRIYLGVHWRFDAAAASDIKQADGKVNKHPDNISYSNVWTAPRAAGDPRPTGGVPLGLGIANDIWSHAMKAPPPPPSMMMTAATTTTAVKLSNTTFN